MVQHAPRNEEHSGGAKTLHLDLCIHMLLLTFPFSQKDH